MTINHSEDIELGKYYRDVSRVPILTPHEEKLLAELGTPEAQQALVRGHMKFVIKIALQYKSYGFPIKDLIQAGNEGMAIAAKKFTTGKNCSFIGYAVWWIRAKIQEYIRRNWSLVKIGTTQYEVALFNRRLSKHKKSLEEIAEKHNKTFEEISRMDEEMMGRMSGDASLNIPIARSPEDAGDQDLQEFISDQSEDSTPENALEIRENQDIIHSTITRAIGSLKERERYILKERTLSETPLTLETLGSELGLSKERIRQIEEKAKVKIAKYIAELSEEEKSQIFDALGY